MESGKATICSADYCLLLHLLLTATCHRTVQNLDSGLWTGPWTDDDDGDDDDDDDDSFIQYTAYCTHEKG